MSFCLQHIGQPKANAHPSESDSVSTLLSHIHCICGSNVYIIQYILLQTIVPDVLLEHYVMMTCPEHSHPVDSDIQRQCAYSMPAVAVTLGPENWPFLKDIYLTMAQSLQVNGSFVG